MSRVWLKYLGVTAAVASLVVSVANCTGSKATVAEDSPVQANLSERHAVVEILSPLLPAQTRALAKIRIDEMGKDAHIVADNASESLKKMLQEAGVDALDRSRYAYLAFATTGSEAHLELLQLGGVVADPKLLPAGVHHRLLLPTDQPQGLLAQVELFCNEHGSGTRACREMVRLEPAEGFVIADMFTGADHPGRAAFVDTLDAPSSKTAYLDRMTPALHSFLAADGPAAVHASLQGLWALAAVEDAAQARRAIKNATPTNYWKMFLRGQLFASATYLHDASAAEFEDLALMVDAQDSSADNESTPASVVFDLVATFTEHGRKVYANGRTDAALPEVLVGQPLASLSSSVSLLGLLDSAQAPFWLESDDASVSAIWNMMGYSVGSSLAFSTALLEYPAGLLSGALGAQSPSFQQMLAAQLGTDPADTPTLHQLLGFDRLELVVGQAVVGQAVVGQAVVGQADDAEVADARDLQAGLVVEWPEAVFSRPEKAVEALNAFQGLITGNESGRTFGAELVDTDDGGQQLRIALNTTFGSAQRNPTTTSQWQMSVDLAALPPEIVPRGFPRNSTRLGDQLHMAGVAASTHQHVRLMLTDGAFEPAKTLGGFDAEAFVAHKPQTSWQSCMQGFRIQSFGAIDTMDMLPPERRDEAYLKLFDRAETSAAKCATKYPDHAEDFERARAYWIAYRGAQHAGHFAFVEARADFKEACSLGLESACAEQARLEALPDFHMLAVEPYGGNLPTEFDFRYVMTDRGVFDGTDLLVSADQLQKQPAKASETVSGALEAERDELLKASTDGGPTGTAEPYKPGIRIAADAMTDAALVAALTAGLRDLGHPSGLIARGPRPFTSKMVFVTSPNGSKEIPLRVHVGARGIDVLESGKRLAPVGGCPDEGPTICLSLQGEEAGKLFAPVKKMWRSGEVEKAAPALEQALAAYQLHKLYAVLHELKQRHPNANALAVTVEQGIPIALPAQVVSLAKYEREAERYESIEALRDAGFKKSGYNWTPLFKLTFLCVL